jgi:hypothetical protein
MTLRPQFTKVEDELKSDHPAVAVDLAMESFALAAPPPPPGKQSSHRDASMKRDTDV